MFKTVIFVSIVSFFLSACSTQQVVGTGIAAAKLPGKVVEGTAGVAGGVVGGVAGGVVGGSTGAKLGKAAGQSAAKNAVPSL